MRGEERGKGEGEGKEEVVGMEDLGMGELEEGKGLEGEEGEKRG